MPILLYICSGFNIKLLIDMEIKVFYSLDCMQSGKSVFCQRVHDMEKFSYESAVCFLKSVYGKDCIIEFIVV